MFLVLSTTGGVEDRKHIRDDWRNIIHYDMAYFFILASDSRFDRDVAEENAKHKDILQMKHMDSYHNLTLTVMGAFHYFYLFHPNVDYFMKVDSDCAINIPHIREKVDELIQDKEDYVGECRVGQKYNTENRAMKNYIPAELPNGDRNISAYARGGGYLISRRVLPKLLVAFRYLPFVGHHEDVNVGRAMDLAGVSCLNVSNWLARTGCKSSGGCKQYYIAHRQEGESILEIRQYFQIVFPSWNSKYIHNDITIDFNNDKHGSEKKHAFNYWNLFYIITIVGSLIIIVYNTNEFR